MSYAEFVRCWNVVKPQTFASRYPCARILLQQEHTHIAHILGVSPSVLKDWLHTWEARGWIVRLALETGHRFPSSLPVRGVIGGEESALHQDEISHVAPMNDNGNEPEDGDEEVREPVAQEADQESPAENDGEDRVETSSHGLLQPIFTKEQQKAFEEVWEREEKKRHEELGLPWTGLHGELALVRNAEQRLLTGRASPRPVPPREEKKRYILYLTDEERALFPDMASGVSPMHETTCGMFMRVRFEREQLLTLTGLKNEAKEALIVYISRRLRFDVTRLRFEMIRYVQRHFHPPTEHRQEALSRCIVSWAKARNIDPLHPDLRTGQWLVSSHVMHTALQYGTGLITRIKTSHGQYRQNDWLLTIPGFEAVEFMVKD